MRSYVAIHFQKEEKKETKLHCLLSYPVCLAEKNTWVSTVTIRGKQCDKSALQSSSGTNLSCLPQSIHWFIGEETIIAQRVPGCQPQQILSVAK